MNLLTRHPRVAAWIVTLALIGVGTLGGIWGLQALQPDLPANLAHVRGYIIDIRPNGFFAMQVPGQTGILWFEPAKGASISSAHLERHLLEHAVTDVYYQVQQGVLLAWEVD
jgi:hypothetical protein